MSVREARTYLPVIFYESDSALGVYADASLTLVGGEWVLVSWEEGTILVGPDWRDVIRRWDGRGEPVGLWPDWPLPEEYAERVEEFWAGWARRRGLTFVCPSFICRRYWGGVVDE